MTWMIFWMRRTARNMRADLSGSLEVALDLGAIAVATTAFIAVAREGLETALFFWSAVQAAGSTLSPSSGSPSASRRRSSSPGCSTAAR